MLKMKTSHFPSFGGVNTYMHASSIHSSVGIVSAFNWIQWCTGWIKLSLQLNGMVLVGGTRGGSLGAGAEKSSAGRRCKGQGPAAFRGERGPRRVGLTRENPTKPIVSNKDIPDLDVDRSLPQVAEHTSHIQKPALVCIMGPSKGPSSVWKSLIFKPWILVGLLLVLNSTFLHR